MFGKTDSMREGYDTMEVCLNGHQITDMAVSQPISRQPFCSKCGSATITGCTQCQRLIRGHRHIPGVFSVHRTPVPKYCIDCGTPYPWQTAAIQNFNEILHETDLTEQQLAEAEKALPDVIQDGPKTEIASMRLGKVLKSLQKPAYDIAVKVVTDIASDTAKKIMGL